ncbi:CDP-diacylglycerol--glycerol-3-phosphate 3-phosphatidyltransferase [Mycoplasma procyoni]|uniref:CDP-diacylglycerol--glycerol-3-phosphate 3-phosphatidyltransferase n=1 Tax=Mycoplasma procyoni TaxID=568784 RepID=UPI00197BADA8|nr:CDP-diacylglycerol--glycerol-3-phosphate 3-phosphatidyltransferase [Mycoplasma procyoni]MBN3534494.1 CDP-diacylglycerol--glycerol-3-phosphate 3-phosphatidyltransferase [Mycoplasma procyoni]
MNKKNLPNILTISRMIAFIPFLIFMLVFSFSKPAYSVKSNLYWALTLALVIFISAMITDFLDGFLARKYNVVSNFGKLFDPIADKVMTATAMVFLAYFGWIEIWIVVLFIARDIIVDGSRNLAAKSNREVAASIWGKIKTMIQSIVLILMMLVLPLVEGNAFVIVYWLFNTLMIVALGFSLYSGFLYVYAIKDLIKFKHE